MYKINARQSIYSWTPNDFKFNTPDSTDNFVSMCRTNIHFGEYTMKLSVKMNNVLYL